jgi:drug/metabolite transporter (DMT)-like permease
MGALAALWGASYLFIKVSLDDLGPVEIVFARTALASLVLAPVALRRGAFAPLRRAWRWIPLLAVVQIVAPFLLITVGEQHISSSLAGILVSAAPIFTALLALRFDHAERSRGWRLVGVVLGIAGVGLLFGVDLTGGTEQALGGLAVLLASLGYAIGALLLKHRLKGVPPVGIVASTMGVSALILVPALPFALPHSHAPGLDTVGAMLALGIGATGLAFLIFYTLIADVGPARASIVAYVAPGFAVFYGALLLDESIGVGTVVGLVLILGGSYLAAEGRIPWRARTAAVEPVGELGDPEAEAEARALEARR